MLPFDHGTNRDPEGATLGENLEILASLISVLDRIENPTSGRNVKDKTENRDSSRTRAAAIAKVHHLCMGVHVVAKKGKGCLGMCSNRVYKTSHSGSECGGKHVNVFSRAARRNAVLYYTTTTTSMSLSQSLSQSTAQDAGRGLLLALRITHQSNKPLGHQQGKRRPITAIPRP